MAQPLPEPVTDRAASLVRAALLLGAVGILAACSTRIEESAYDGLVLGDSKATVLRKLGELPSISAVSPALVRAAGAPGPQTPSADADFVLLAAAAVDGEPSAAEREYLLHYDLWYFEERDRRRTVLLTFSGDSLELIQGHRPGSWSEKIF